MNELYAAEPGFVGTATELKLFLERFGPTSGHYLAALPRSWELEVASQFAKARPVEQQRAKLALRRARERMAVLTRPHLPWGGSDWRTEAAKLTAKPSPKLLSAVVGPEGNHELPEGLVAVDDFALDATAEEEIAATPQEICRVCSIILEVRGDIHIVDPYFDPCRDSYANVLRVLLQRMAVRPVMSLTIWSRAELVLWQSQRTAAELREAIRRAGRSITQELPVTLNLLDDMGTSQKMHARYLFSVKGGVSIDNGFQQLSNQLRTRAGPMSTAILDLHLWRYHERADHAPIVQAVEVPLGRRGRQR